MVADILEKPGARTSAAMICVEFPLNKLYHMQFISHKIKKNNSLFHRHIIISLWVIWKKDWLLNMHFFTLVENWLSWSETTCRERSWDLEFTKEIDISPTSESYGVFIIGDCVTNVLHSNIAVCLPVGLPHNIHPISRPRPWVQTMVYIMPVALLQYVISCYRVMTVPDCILSSMKSQDPILAPHDAHMGQIRDA